MYVYLANFIIQTLIHETKRFTSVGINFDMEKRRSKKLEQKEVVSSAEKKSGNWSNRLSK